MARKLTLAELEASNQQFTPFSNRKRTKKEAVSEFFYDHRKWLPVVIVLIVLGAVGVVLSVTANKADITIMVATGEGVVDSESRRVFESYLQYYTPDIDDNTSTTCKVRAGYFNLAGRKMSSEESEASLAFENAVTDGSVSVIIADAQTASYLTARDAVASFADVLPDGDYEKGVNAVMISDTDIFAPKTGRFAFAENDDGLSKTFGGYYLLVSKAAVDAGGSAGKAAAEFLSAVLDGMGKDPTLRTVPEKNSEAG